MFMTACGDLGGSAVTQPDDNASDAAPTGTFGVSEAFGGPYLSDADGAITDASDARVVSVAPGGSFFVQVDYEDPSGITNIDVNLVNSSPEGLAGTLDPTQSFFTLGQPTGISEPSGCDLSDNPTSVSCIYEVRVADDAVNITELDGLGDEFAYVFRTQVTDAAGNTSDEAERGYVVVTGGDGEPEPTPEPETCTNPVEIPDEALETALRVELGKPEGDLTCEDLASLTELNYNGSNEEIASIGSLEGLQYAVNLEALNLFGNDVSDLSPLQNLITLTVLNLSGNMITDISPLQNLTNLTELDLSNNGRLDREADTRQELSDISPLQSLTKLTSLNLGTNGRIGNTLDGTISDISPLGNLTNLTFLELGGNDVSDISPLRNLTNLTELSLFNNELTDLGGLQDLTNLTELNIGTNELENDLDGLQNLTNLVRLDASDSGVVDIGALQNLTRLSVLNLGNDTLTNDVNVNRITDTTTLQNLTELTELELDSNQISDISALTNLTNLADLDLNDNEVSDIEPLVANAGLSAGDRVRLFFNPLETCPGDEDRADIETLQERGVEVFFDESENCDNEGEPEPQPGTCTDPVEIQDIDLEEAIRDALDKPRSEGELTCEDLAGLKEASVSYASVASLEGLQYATNLELLSLTINESDQQHFVSDLSPLTGLEKLNTVILINEEIEDLTPLASLSSLETLTLAVDSSDNFDQLAGLANTNLKSLSLPANNITDLSFLQGLTSLTDLSLSENNISDLTPLRNLNNLESLSLIRNQVDDLSALQSLTDLIELYLTGNSIGDITPLQNLTNLARLDFTNNEVSDIAPLQNLTKLTELSFSSNKVSDIMPLQNLTKLTELSFSRNEVSDIAPLQNLTNLAELRFVNNEVSDITPLIKNEGLGEGDIIYLPDDSLDLSCGTENRAAVDALIERGVIVDINALVDCSDVVDFADNILEDLVREALRQPRGELTENDLESLRELKYEPESSSSSVESLEGLQFAVNLESLGLPDNSVSDLSPLSALVQLRNLDLAKNDNITDISVLQNLVNLETIDLSANNISDLSPLQDLGALRELRMSFNTVSDLSPLQGLTELRVLLLTGNLIEEVDALANLTNLRRLLLSRNPIVDISGLAENEGLAAGDPVELLDTFLDTCPGTDDREDIDTLIERGAVVRFDEPEDCGG